MAEFKQTPESAEELLEDVLQDFISDPTSRFPGMTYEQGVSNTLQWLLDGYDDEHPLSE